MNDSSNNLNDKRLDDALNAMFTRREASTDGRQLAEATLARLDDMRHRSRHPMLIRALKIAGPLAAAAVLLAAVAIFVSPAPVTADQALNTAQKFFDTKTEVNVFALTTTVTGQRGTHTLKGTLWQSEGDKFCYRVETPRNELFYIGSDGETFWTKRQDHPVITFDGIGSLKESEAAQGFMGQFLRLNRILADIRQGGDTKIENPFEDRHKVRVRLEPPHHGDLPRPPRPEGGWVSHVEIDVNQESQKVDRLTIVVTGGDMTRTTELVRTAAESVDPAIFDYRRYVDDKGVLTAEEARQLREQRDDRKPPMFEPRRPFTDEEHKNMMRNWDDFKRQHPNPDDRRHKWDELRHRFGPKPPGPPPEGPPEGAGAPDAGGPPPEPPV